jgi:hypothetical protein
MGNCFGYFHLGGDIGERLFLGIRNRVFFLAVAMVDLDLLGVVGLSGKEKSEMSRCPCSAFLVHRECLLRAHKCRLFGQDNNVQMIQDQNRSIWRIYVESYDKLKPNSDSQSMQPNVLQYATKEPTEYQRSLRLLVIVWSIFSILSTIIGMLVSLEGAGTWPQWHGWYWTLTCTLSGAIGGIVSGIAVALLCVLIRFVVKKIWGRLDKGRESHGT